MVSALILVQAPSHYQDPEFREVRICMANP